MLEAFSLALLIGFAAYRIVQLLRLDSILERPRFAFLNWLGLRGVRSPLARSSAQLLSCSQCLSVWVSGGVFLAAWGLADGVPLPALVWGASAGVASLCAHYSERRTVALSSGAP